MSFGNFGFSEILIIAVIVLIFFGPRRMPEIGRAVGGAMREFRRGLNEIQRELQEAERAAKIDPDAPSAKTGSTAKTDSAAKTEPTSTAPPTPLAAAMASPSEPRSAERTEVDGTDDTEIKRARVDSAEIDGAEVDSAEVVGTDEALEGGATEEIEEEEEGSERAD